MLVVAPVTLEGAVVRLEPLAPAHAADLFDAGQDASIWPYMPVNPSASVESVYAWIDAALRERESGSQLPFAIITRTTEHAVGSTRYLNIMPRDNGLEIGWTWLKLSVQRTALNTECKYLLLRHAFETLGAIRVQLKTDRRNEVSQRAIERIGAVREGILRKHMIVQDGYERDTVMYSITDSEWPLVKERLESRMRGA